MNSNQDFLNHPEYRANVGIMLVNDEHKILAGEAYHYPGEWMMPQGGIDPDESPFEAMQRELVEETTITYAQTKLIREHEEWLTYHLSKPLEKDGGVFIGQNQKWFLLEYNGPIPNADNAQDREFSQFDWVDKNWLFERTARFKMQIYKDIFAVFEKHFPG